MSIGTDRPDQGWVGTLESKGCWESLMGADHLPFQPKYFRILQRLTNGLFNPSFGHKFEVSLQNASHHIEAPFLL